MIHSPEFTRNCEKAISYKERQKGVECPFQTGKWDPKAYNNYPRLKNSGREYSGSEEIFKVENKLFRDTNQPYNITPYATTYIYIISKKINGKTFYKIGKGGSGDSYSRLGNAQTFLIPGLEDIGFIVHFLFFYKKAPYLSSKEQINEYIELQLHENLRHHFTASNITFPSAKPSEWYLVDEKHKLFFFGIIFDIVGSFRNSVQPMSIWKFISKKPGYEVVNLFPERAMISRLEKYTLYKKLNENLKSLRNKYLPFRPQKGTIKPSQTNEGNMGLFRKAFKEEIDEEHIIQFEGHNYKLKDLYYDKKKKNEAPTQKFAVLEELSETFHMEPFQKHSIILYVQPEFSQLQRLISIGDFLKIYKMWKEKNPNWIYNEWPLKPNYEYYNNEQKIETFESDESEVLLVPQWYSNPEVQLSYGHLFLNAIGDERYHEDYSVKDSKVKTLWEPVIIKESNGIWLERREVDPITKKEVEPENKETVEMIRIMSIKGVKEKIPGTQLGRERSKAFIEVCGFNLHPGDEIRLKADYYTHYDVLFEPYNIEEFQYWSTYVIKKVYTFSVNENEIRFDIKAKYPDITAKKQDTLYYNVQGFPNEKLRKISKTISDKEPVLIKVKPSEYACFGEQEHNLDVYHYAYCREYSDEEYEIEYLPPWNALGQWSKESSDKPYRELHLKKTIDKYAKRVNLENTKQLREYNNYKQELEGEYDIESIYGHSLDAIQIKGITSHNGLIERSKKENKKPEYWVKWKYHKKGVDQFQDANALFESNPSFVENYWATVNKRKTLRKRKGGNKTKKIK